MLVLDEYPHLQKLIAGGDGVIQGLVDQYEGKSKLKIILCGSHMDIMRSLVEHAAPLYGRAGLVLHLKALDYCEASAYFPTFSNEDKVRLYAAFGGSPGLLRHIDPGKTVRENIIDVFMEPDGVGTTLTDMLLSELSKVEKANLVLSALATGPLRFSELLAKTGMESSPVLDYVLKKLDKMEVVRKEFPINAKNDRRRTFYSIGDLPMRFHRRFVEPNMDNVNYSGAQAAYDAAVEEEFETQYVPQVFEEIVKQFLIRRNRAGKMPVRIDDIGTYFYNLPELRKNGRFDVVTLDKDGCVCYEVKFRNHPMTQAEVDAEKLLVAKSPLVCTRFGFVTKAGYEGVAPSPDLTLWTLDDLYDPENF